MKIYYKEVQGFTQKWIWVLLLIITIIPVYGIFQQVILKIPFGNNPMPDIGLYLFLALMLGFLFLFNRLKLTTEINSECIKINFLPLVFNKTFKLDEIDNAEVIKYDFVGWGYRTSPKYGTVYNTAGNIAVQLILKNGKKYLIGTQNQFEIKKILSELELLKKA